MRFEVDAGVVVELVETGSVQAGGGGDVLAGVGDELVGDGPVVDLGLLEGDAERLAAGFERVAAVGEREGKGAQVDEPSLMPPAGVVGVILDGAPGEQGAAGVDRLGTQPWAELRSLPLALSVYGAEEAEGPAAEELASALAPVRGDAGDVKQQVEPDDGAPVAVPEPVSGTAGPRATATAATTATGFRSPGATSAVAPLA